MYTSQQDERTEEGLAGALADMQHLTASSVETVG